MKDRSLRRARKAAVLNARRFRPSKVDPTRTLTLRRALAAEMRKRFALLKGRIVKLVVDEDCFGLKERAHDPFAANAFCPTGVGGGVDPSCGKGSSGIHQRAMAAVRGIRESVGGSLTAFIDRVPGGKSLRSKLAGLKEGLENRYGKNTAKLIVGGANAISWGAFGVGAAVGMPNYVPASGLMAVGAVLAEGYLQARRAGKALRGLVGNEENFTFNYDPDQPRDEKGQWSSMTGAELLGHAVKIEGHVKEEQPKAGEGLRGEIAKATVAGFKRDLEAIHKERALRQLLKDYHAETDPTTKQWLKDRLELIHGHTLTGNAKSLDDAGILHESRALFDALVAEWALVGNYDPEQPRDDHGRFGSEGGSPAPKVGTIEHLRAIVGAAKRLYPNDPASGLAMVRKYGYPNMREANYKEGFGEARGTGSPTGEDKSSTTPTPPTAPSAVRTPSRGEVASTISRLADQSRYNFVSMNDLHDALGKPDLPSFRSHVKALWDAGAVTMSESEGRGGRTERDRETAVTVPSSRSHGGPAYMTHLSVADAGLLGRMTRNSALTVNTGRWAFHSDPAKVAAFKDWIKSQMDATLRSRTERELWQMYAERGFRQGAGRAFDDVRTRERTLSATSQEHLDFYRGTREEFLRSSFGRPVAVEKVQLLAGRSFDDLENVTADMSTRMTRALTDGLVTGASPHEIARDLNDELDLGRNRAETIARTEIVRAHAEGQLTALEDLGVEQVGVAVEWSTTGDDKVCDECSPLEGVVLTIDEARGMLPRHLNCRCAWIPANVGEDKADQKDTKREIDAALDESGLDIEIGRDRPRSTLNEGATENIFCPTGEGGGVDPSCSLSTGGKSPKTYIPKTPKAVQSPSTKDLEKAKASLSNTLSEGLKDSVAKGYVTQAGADRVEREVGRLMDSAPPGVLAHIAHAVNEVSLHDDPASLGRLAGSRRHRIDPGHEAAGTWETGSGTIYLTTRESIVGDLRQSLAHEFAHATDGPGSYKGFTKPAYSGEKGWKDVWSSEVSRPGALTDYARKNPKEGWAEFGRIVLTNPDRARSSFPRAWGFWQFKGLVEGQTTNITVTLLGDD